MRRLERNGMVERCVLPASPVAVEYSPTALGASLRGPFAHLYDWTVAYASESRERRRNHRQRGLR